MPFQSKLFTQIGRITLWRCCRSNCSRS